MEKSSSSRVFRPCSAGRVISDSAASMLCLNWLCVPTRYAIADSPGRFSTSDGRLRGQAFAAMTGVKLAVHFPPPTVSTNTPRSGKFGSLSQRAISRRPIGRNPSCSGFGSSCPCALENRDLHRCHALHRLRGRDKRTEINGLAESEIVRMKDAAPAVRQNAIAENFQATRPSHRCGNNPV